MLAMPDNAGSAPINTDPHATIQRAGTEEIEAVRRGLAAWSAGKPKAVHMAARSLDGWLSTCQHDPEGKFNGDVNIFACTARAVETLRAAVTDTQHHQVLKHQ